uniref:RRM domain-containing protein n=1 Tax=Heterorhabditis bacteriophora TaxID=37862 RepID=A0A1I7XAG3_HETBA
MSDNWGCEQDLFDSSPFGCSKSLMELVEGLSSKKSEVVPCVLKKKARFAPKILKKKSSINKVNKEPNLKRVTFEVEQLFSRESTGQDKNTARERLVISLGGLPPKGRVRKQKATQKSVLLLCVRLLHKHKQAVYISLVGDRVAVMILRYQLKNKMVSQVRRGEWRRLEHRSVSRSVSRSRSRSVSRDREPSRSLSRSPDIRRGGRRSRSRSRSPYRGRRGGGDSRSRRDSDNGRSSKWNRQSKREDPDPSRCLGCFNLSIYTTEKDLRDIFGEFGEIEKVELVYDHPTGRSRGFGFIYFDKLEDACAARDKLSGTELDGHKIRVDFSLTKRAHTPTPGQYMGAIRGGRGRFGGYRSDRRDSYRDGYRDSYRRRSPSPRRFLMPIYFNHCSRRSPSPRRDRRRSRSYD